MLRGNLETLMPSSPSGQGTELSELPELWDSEKQGPFLGTCMAGDKGPMCSTSKCLQLARPLPMMAWTKNSASKSGRRQNRERAEKIPDRSCHPICF